VRTAESTPRAGRRMVSVSMAVLLGVSLAGCSGGTGDPRPSPTPTAPGATSTPATTPTPTAAPALSPAGGARENLDYFNTIVSALLAASPGADGRAYVDALAGGGFDKAAMEVGFDRTHADLAADSVQFSVRFGGECLIGQNGPASGGFHSTVAPLLGTGTCLVGATRQIDW